MFLRHPDPGHTKTRLIPALGAEGAAELHRVVVEHTVAVAASLVRDAVRTWLLVDPPAAVPAVESWLGPPAGMVVLPQPPGDLGERLKSSMAAAFLAGARRVVAIGTDCPDLEARHLEAALEALEAREAVVGPAADGGYYLLGLSQPLLSVFDAIPWSSDRTLEVTRRRLAAAGARVAETPAEMGSAMASLLKERGLLPEGARV